MILQNGRVKLSHPYVLYAIVPAFGGEKLNIFVILVILVSFYRRSWFAGTVKCLMCPTPDVCIWMQDEVK